MFSCDVLGDDFSRGARSQSQSQLDPTPEIGRPRPSVPPLLPRPLPRHPGAARSIASYPPPLPALFRRGRRAPGVHAAPHRVVPGRQEPRQADSLPPPHRSPNCLALPSAFCLFFCSRKTSWNVYLRCCIDFFCSAVLISCTPPPILINFFILHISQRPKIVFRYCLLLCSMIFNFLVVCRDSSLLVPPKNCRFAFLVSKTHLC